MISAIKEEGLRSDWAWERRQTGWRVKRIKIEKRKEKRIKIEKREVEKIKVNFLLRQN